jgi:hypothetical protein
MDGRNILKGGRIEVFKEGRDRRKEGTRNGWMEGTTTEGLDGRKEGRKDGRK